MADTFGPKPHFKRRNLDTDIISRYHKKASKIKFATKYENFQTIIVDLCSISSFSNFISPQEVGEHEKTERMKKMAKKREENSKKWQKKFRFCYQ